MDNIQLTQLVYTRISHDLSGAAGAIHNGTELLNEDLSFAEQASSLIYSSAVNLMNRLRFFRQTFGLQNKEDADTTTDYLTTFSMPFSIKGECTTNLQRSLIMALTDLFYKGAVFEVKNDEIIAKGEAVKDYPLIIDILQEGKSSDSANDAPAVFAYEVAQQRHKKLVFTKDLSSVKITFKDGR